MFSLSDGPLGLTIELSNVGFQGYSVSLMAISVFWKIMLVSMVAIHTRLRGMRLSNPSARSIASETQTKNSWPKTIALG